MKFAHYPMLAFRVLMDDVLPLCDPWQWSEGVLEKIYQVCGAFTFTVTVMRDMRQLPLLAQLHFKAGEEKVTLSLNEWCIHKGLGRKGNVLLNKKLLQILNEEAFGIVGAQTDPTENLLDDLSCQSGGDSPFQYTDWSRFTGKMEKENEVSIQGVFNHDLIAIRLKQMEDPQRRLQRLVREEPPIMHRQIHRWSMVKRDGYSLCKPDGRRRTRTDSSKCKRRKKSSVRYL